MKKKLRSRINEIFSEELLNALNRVCDDKTLPDNNTKVDMTLDILDMFGVNYNMLGPGTNRLAVLIDGVVFKIAMDDWGKRDNLNEFAMSKELQPYVIKVFEVNTNGLIMTCEYVTVISQEEFRENREEILSILDDLSQGYLLGDVGYVQKNYLNWGYTDNNDLVILDFAYIYKIIGNELTCTNPECNKSYLDYTHDYSLLKCPHCGKSYTFVDIRRRYTKNEEMGFVKLTKELSYKTTGTSLEVEVPDVKTEETVKENVEEPVKEEINMSAMMDRHYDGNYKPFNLADRFGIPEASSSYFESVKARYIKDDEVTAEDLNEKSEQLFEPIASEVLDDEEEEEESWDDCFNRTLEEITNSMMKYGTTADPNNKQYNKHQQNQQKPRQNNQNNNSGKNTYQQQNRQQTQRQQNNTQREEKEERIRRESMPQRGTVAYMLMTAGKKDSDGQVSNPNTVHAMLERYKERENKMEKEKEVSIVNETIEEKREEKPVNKPQQNQQKPRQNKNNNTRKENVKPKVEETVKEEVVNNVKEEKYSNEVEVSEIKEEVKGEVIETSIIEERNGEMAKFFKGDGENQLDMSKEVAEYVDEHDEATNVEVKETDENPEVKEEEIKDKKPEVKKEDIEAVIEKRRNEKKLSSIKVSRVDNVPRPPEEEANIIPQVNVSVNVGIDDALDEMVAEINNRDKQEIPSTYEEALKSMKAREITSSIKVTKPEVKSTPSEPEVITNTQPEVDVEAKGYEVEAEDKPQILTGTVITVKADDLRNKGIKIPLASATNSSSIKVTKVDNHEEESEMMKLINSARGE